MRATSPIDVTRLIDDSPVGRYQWGVLILCGLCMILDGFDVQAMGYVAPALLQDWKVDKALLGPVFGAGLLGLLVGSLVISVLADKLGRRPVLIGSTFFFAVCMLLTPLTSTLDQLMVMRFITGIGLGAIMPNAMALSGEFSPQRKRVSIMMIVSCGFTVGAMLGGVLAAALIPRFGWQSVFYVGRAAPLLMGLAMLKYLPESIQFQVMHHAPATRIADLLRRVLPGTDLGRTPVFAVPEKKEGGVPVVRLFSEGRAGLTLILWTISFMNLIALYFLSNWLPTLAGSTGMGLENAVLLGAMLQFGGMLGTVTMGWLIDRVGFRRVLLPCFVVAAGSIALIGHSSASLAMLFAVVFVTGFAVVGGQPAINAMAASFYPTALRSTGIGWCLGIGRIGAVIGPVVGGELIRLELAQSSLFYAAALPSVVIVMVVLLGIRSQGGAPVVPRVAHAH